MNKEWIKKIILANIFIIPLVILLFFVDPLKQNQAYHNFADSINMFGVPNFHNVFSNMLFLIFPLMGLKEYFTRKSNYTISWLVFLVGVLLVAPGSAYYHLNPNDQTLVWDRLPMTIAFMGLTSFVFTEVFKIKFEGIFLSILLAIGAYSIAHWVIFDDLRVYAWVQLTPILAIFYIAFALPTHSLKPKYLTIGVGFYLGAKLTEFYDLPIYEMLNYSGHSIKHHLAAFTVFSLMLMKKKDA